MTNNPIIIDLKILDESYKIPVTFGLVTEVEEEMGGLIKVLNKFQNSEWQVQDIVHLLHIMISQDKEPPAYDHLGDTVVRYGATTFFDPILKFLLSAVMGLPEQSLAKKAA